MALVLGHGYSFPMAPTGTLLVIDDEPQIRRLIRNALAGDFARIVEAVDGTSALDLAAAARPTMIVLDLGLPDIDGADVCRGIRAWSSAPIIVLSARHTEAEKVALFDAGADDYVTKPFSTEEFRARVRAILRRSAVGTHDAQTIEFGPYTLDLVARTLSRAGDVAEGAATVVHLTPIEWELLRALVTNAGKTLTHTQLFTAAWPGRTYGDAQQYLRFHVANLRRKVEENVLSPQFIITEPGIGYRFARD